MPGAEGPGGSIGGVNHRKNGADSEWGRSFRQHGENRRICSDTSEASSADRKRHINSSKSEKYPRRRIHDAPWRQWGRVSRVVSSCLWLLLALSIQIRVSADETGTKEQKGSPHHQGLGTVLAPKDDEPELSIAAKRCASNHPVVGTVAQITSLAWEVRRSHQTHTTACDVCLLSNVQTQMFLHGERYKGQYTKKKTIGAGNGTLTRFGLFAGGGPHYSH